MLLLVDKRLMDLGIGHHTLITKRKVLEFLDSVSNNLQNDPIRLQTYLSSYASCMKVNVSIKTYDVRMEGIKENNRKLLEEIRDAVGKWTGER